MHEVKSVYIFDSDTKKPQIFDIFEEDFGGMYLLAPVGTVNPTRVVSKDCVFNSEDECIKAHEKECAAEKRRYENENKDIHHLIANLIYAIVSGRRVPDTEMTEIKSSAKNLIGDDFEKIILHMKQRDQAKKDLERKRTEENEAELNGSKRMAIRANRMNKVK